MASAEFIDDKWKNPRYGFQCLHYSVSEGAKFLDLVILNKTRHQGTLRVKTIEAEAKENEDFKPVDQEIRFSEGQATAFVKIEIIDDDSWEPDEDFYVQLYDPNTLEELEGRDTKTRITIIDDDKPGFVSFESNQTITTLAQTGVAYVHLKRENGSDGVVTVYFKTEELDKTENTARDGKDYVGKRGTITFEPQETSKTIEIEIIPH